MGRWFWLLWDFFRNQKDLDFWRISVVELKLVVAAPFLDFSGQHEKPSLKHENQPPSKMASQISATKPQKITLLACKSVKMVILKGLQSIGKNRYRQNKDPAYDSILFFVGPPRGHLCGCLAQQQTGPPPPNSTRKMARRFLFFLCLPKIHVRTKNQSTKVTHTSFYTQKTNTQDP